MSDAQTQIDQLVKSNDIVLFMKGTPGFPQCGFTPRTICIFIQWFRRALAAVSGSCHPFRDMLLPWSCSGSPAIPTPRLWNKPPRTAYISPCHSKRSL